MAYKKYFNKREGIFVLIDDKKLKESKKKASEMGLNLTEYIDLLLSKDLGIRKDRIKSQKRKIIINNFVKIWFEQSKAVNAIINRMENGHINAFKYQATNLLEGDFKEFCFDNDLDPEKKYIKQIEYLLLKSFKNKKNKNIKEKEKEAGQEREKEAIFDIIDGEKVFRSAGTISKPKNLDWNL